MPKNKQSNLIANVKMPFYQQTYYKLRKKGEGGYLELVNYPALLSNIFSLPPQIFLFIKYKRNRLLRVNFIE